MAWLRLFVSQLGHGRTEIAEAMAKQGEQLAFFPIWNHAHPPAIELAAKLAELAPGDLNRVFFTSGGSEAVESAWKLIRQYYAETGEPRRYKVISRQSRLSWNNHGCFVDQWAYRLQKHIRTVGPGHFLC